MENKKTLMISEAIKRQRESVEKFKETLRKAERDVEKSLLGVEIAHEGLLNTIKAHKKT